MSGLSTRYTRTGPLNPANQIPAAEMFRRLNGDVLPPEQILALCAEHGITDAELVRGKVQALHPHYRWAVALETAPQVERLAAERAGAR